MNDRSSAIGFRPWRGSTKWPVAVALLASGMACRPAGSLEGGAPQTQTGAISASVRADESAREGNVARTTRSGRYRVSIRPERAPAAIGPLHAWIVEVKRPEGGPVDVHQLFFDGGMPAHGHGFETSPRVTDVLGPGLFRVDGVRFHMAGDWTIQVQLLGPDGPDDAVFEVEILP